MWMKWMCWLHNTILMCLRWDTFYYFIPFCVVEEKKKPIPLFTVTIFTNIYWPFSFFFFCWSVGRYNMYLLCMDKWSNEQKIKKKKPLCFWSFIAFCIYFLSFGAWWWFVFGYLAVGKDNTHITHIHKLYI